MNTSIFKHTNKNIVVLAAIAAIAALISIIGVSTFANATPNEQGNPQDAYFSVSDVINNPDYSVSAVNAVDENADNNDSETNSINQALISDNNQVNNNTNSEANTNIRPTDVEHSDAGEIILYTDVNYSTMGASAAINRLNQLRWEACAEGIRDPRNESRNLTTADYVPIKWSTDMEWIAQTRAAEGCFTMSHTRPTGKDCFTCSHNGKYSGGEVLAWNYTGMAQGIEQWYEEKYDWVHQTGGVTGHYTSMIDPDNIYFGLGTAKVPTNGYYTTAGEFNSQTGLEEAETPEKGQYKQAMAFRANAFNYDIYYPQSMEARSDYQIGVVGVLKQETSVRFPAKTNDLDYESSDTSVAEINEYGYIWAKKTGTTTISVYKESTLSKFEYTLTVTPSTRPETEVTNVGDASVTLSWGAIEGATKYAVCEYINGNYYTFSDNVQGTTYTCSPIQNEVEHYFLVQAYVNGSWSKYSSVNFVSATPHGRYKPDDVQGSAIGTSITLSWTAVPAAEKYAIATQNPDGSYKTYTSDCTNTSYTIRDLEDGTQYKCLVQAYFKGDRWSAFDETDLVTVTTKGTRPVVEADATDDGEVTLSWNDIDGADSYVAYEIVNGGFNQIGDFMPAGITSKVVKDLANGYQHTFLVQSHVGGSWSKFSERNYAYATPTGTVKPTISAAEATGTNIKLTWNKVPGASKYAVATKVGSSGYTTYSMDETGLTYTIKGLEDGVTYDCLVQANIYGNWSSFDSGDLKQATTKGTRPVVTAEATGDGEVTLTWAAIDDADKYAAYEVIGNSFNPINENIPSSQCSVVAKDLANGYEHTFLVQSNIDGVWSKFSENNYRSATPTGTVKPKITSATVSGTNITLSWEKVPGASKYAIATKVGSSGYTTYSMDETGTSYKIKGLEEGVTYDCLVQANINGNWSSFDSGDLKQATTKGTRPVVTAEATGDGEVTLTWAAIDDADKYAAYEVIGNSFNPINENIPSSQCSVVAKDLANGYEHTFLVQSNIDGVWSKFSENNYRSATPTGTVKPKITSATVSGTNITLSWGKVPGASKYAIATKVGSSGYTTYSMDETGLSYTIKGLEEGVTYDCLVQANINGKWSSFDGGDLQQATTKGTRPVVTAEATGDGEITLTWDTIDDATKYVAYEVINGQYVQIGAEITAPTTTVTKTDLVNEQQHTFLVQAYVGGTWSKYSENNYVYATPHGAVKPTISSSTSTDTTITVSWASVSGSDGYCAAISTDGTHWTNNMLDKSATMYTFTGLQSSTAYKVLVQRRVGDDWSSFTSSDIKNISTDKAKIATAVYNTSDTLNPTLTFYYDNLNHSSEGTVMYMPTKFDSRTDIPWYNYSEKVTTVLFNDSFKLYATPSCAYWFAGFSKLTTISNMNNFNTKNATSMKEMFSGCKALQNLELIYLNTSNVTDMQQMFCNCNVVGTLNFSNFDTSAVTNMYQMFFHCNSLETLDLSSFITSKLVVANNMFYECDSLKSIDIHNFITDNITTTYNMFYGCEQLKSIAFPQKFYLGIDSSLLGVENKMFYGCKALESVDLSSFDTSDKTSFNQMFYNCSSLRSLDISSFSIAKAISFNECFSGCENLQSVNMPTTKVNNNATTLYGMFSGCSSLKSIDISCLQKFNTDVVTTTMENMFKNCSSLTTIYHLAGSNWSTSYGYSMFQGCVSLKGGNGTLYSDNNVTDNFARVDGLDGKAGYFTVKS